MATLEEILAAPRDAFNVGRVFGEPVVKGDLTLIPVARVSGGGGGGSGPAEEGAEDENSGGGFGGMARPVGVYVVRGDDVSWQPAVDVTVISIAGIALGALMVIVAGKVLKRVFR
jgi:uncharacterized spore protein YtfJ